MPKHPKITGKTFLVIFTFMVAFIGLILIADSLSQSEQVREIVAEFGYVGVMIIAVIAGLNSIVPVPAATFTPIFLAAGLTAPFIILSLTVGTLIADFTGFFLGQLSRKVIESHHPRVFHFFVALKEKREHLVPLVVALFAAFAPLPNEVILIPLGLAGVKFQRLIIPLFIGNLVNQLYLVYGVAALAQYLG